MILSRCFPLHAEPAACLARYASARQDRCAFIQEESNANADRTQGGETDLYGLTKVRNEETLGLFAYDAGTVAL